MSEYFKRLEERLATLKITVHDARDGLLESYVVANRKALDAGLADLALNAADDAVYQKLYEVMSELLAERAADIANPTVRDLRSVRHTMDLKLRHIEFPPEISQMHEIACETLLEKAVEEAQEGSVESGGAGELDEFEKLKQELSEEMGASIRESEAPEAPPVTPEPAPVAEPVEEPEPAAPTAFKFTPKEEESAESEVRTVETPKPVTPVEREEHVQVAAEHADESSLAELFIRTLTERLESESLSPDEARDGIIEAYVATNRNAVKLGDVGLAPEATDTEIEYRVRNMMREFFKERGASFDDPDLDLLTEAKEYLDQQWDVTRMPERVRAKHDEICKAVMDRAQNLKAVMEGEKGSLSVGSFTPSLTKPDIEVEAGAVIPAEPVPTPVEPESVTPEPAPEVRPEPAPEVAPETVPEAPLEEPVQETVPEPIPVEETAEPESVQEEVPEVTEAATETPVEVPVAEVQESGTPEPIEEPVKPEEVAEEPVKEAAVPDWLEPTGEEPSPEAEVAPEPEVVAEPEVTTEPEPVVEAPSVPEPEPVSEQVSVDELLSKVKDLVRDEVASIMAKPTEADVELNPPESVTARIFRNKVFMAWLDVWGQPGYNVYKRVGSNWVRLTSIPLTRPSFAMKVEEGGELVLAVTSVSAQGVESDLSEEIKVTF